MRSVGLFQNALEAAGFATASLTTQTLITAGVGVPRAAYVRFLVGNLLGEAFEVNVQRAVLMDLLSLVWQAPGPGTFVNFPYRWRRGLPSAFTNP